MGGGSDPGAGGGRAPGILPGVTLSSPATPRDRPARAGRDPPPRWAAQKEASTRTADRPTPPLVADHPWCCPPGAARSLSRVSASQRRATLRRWAAEGLALPNGDVRPRPPSSTTPIEPKPEHFFFNNPRHINPYAAEDPTPPRAPRRRWRGESSDVGREPGEAQLCEDASAGSSETPLADAVLEIDGRAMTFPQRRRLEQWLRARGKTLGDIRGA